MKTGGDACKYKSTRRDTERLDETRKTRETMETGGDSYKLL